MTQSSPEPLDCLTPLAMTTVRVNHESGSGVGTVYKLLTF